MAFAHHRFYILPPHRVSLTRGGHNALPPTFSESGIKRGKGNSMQVEVVFRSFHANDSLSDAQILKILGFEEGESFSKLLGVEITEPETDASIGIGDDCGGDITVAF